MPKISVLMPTFRYARYLPEAIESVLAQDYRDFEVIVSDDASPDESGEIIRRYAAKDARIRAHVQPRNLGMVANWNWCLQQATGEYVKYLFGDDRLNHPHALGKMAIELDLNPQVVMVATGRLILDADSNTIEIWDELGDTGIKRGRDVIRHCLLDDRNLVGEPSAVMFRRAAAARGFDPDLRQIVDEEMWFHLLAGGDLAYLSDPLCAFRRHAVQQTAVNAQTSVASVETMLLLARYLDVFATASDRSPDSLAIRRLIFHAVYYSRKNSRRDRRRTAALVEAEELLMRRLTPAGYAMCFLLHRTLKPLVNLDRHFRPSAYSRSGRRPVPNVA